MGGYFLFVVIATSEYHRIAHFPERRRRVKNFRKADVR